MGDASIGTSIAKTTARKGMCFERRADAWLEGLVLGDRTWGVPVGNKGEDRRKYTRFVVREKSKGRVTSGDEVALVNLGLGGALIEHAHVVPPGTFSDLDLELQGNRLRLRCRAAWSVVARQKVDVDGEGIMIYHTGLEFLDVSEEARQTISDHLRCMVEQGKATPSGSGMIIRAYRCDKCGRSFELADREVRPVFTEPRKRPVRAGDVFYHDHGTCEGTLMCLSGEPSLPWSVD